jgi:hypothetical protein
MDWSQERKAQPRFEVWESIRERIGQNPCDKRRKVSEVKPKFPLFSFDRMESDDDHLWGDMRESTEELLHRARTFLHALRQRQGPQLLTSIPLRRLRPRSQYLMCASPLNTPTPRCVQRRA